MIDYSPALNASRKFKEGDRVRDKAELGGVVLETWGNGVKVRWNNEHAGWIDSRFLTHERAASIKQSTGSADT